VGGRDADGSPVDNFTGDQRRALVALSKAFLQEWPHADIKGHRELKGYERSDCPAINMDVLRLEITREEWPGQTLSEMTKGSERRCATILEAT
jgi:N-acetyl-anhydromuramyl-L-alanine amidase AmpD